MAKLSSEDQECISSLEITRAGCGVIPKTQEEQSWEPVVLTLRCGSWQLSLGGADNINSLCLVCRYPTDEISQLIEMLSHLAQETKEVITFEPAEPAFELVAQRTPDGGIKIHVWFDSGNSSTGFYRWDALGIRFYTTQHLLSSFIAELKVDFADPSV